MNYLRILNEENKKHESIRHCVCEICKEKQTCSSECRTFKDYINQHKVQKRKEIFINKMRMQEML